MTVIAERVVNPHLERLEIDSKVSWYPITEAEAQAGGASWVERLSTDYDGVKSELAGSRTEDLLRGNQANIRLLACFLKLAQLELQYAYPKFRLGVSSFFPCEIEVVKISGEPDDRNLGIAFNRPKGVPFLDSTSPLAYAPYRDAVINATNHLVDYAQQPKLLIPKPLPRVRLNGH